jgi:hypothetical protein
MCAPDSMQRQDARAIRWPLEHASTYSEVPANTGHRSAQRTCAPSPAAGCGGPSGGPYGGPLPLACNVRDLRRLTRVYSRIRRGVLAGRHDPPHAQRWGLADVMSSILPGCSTCKGGESPCLLRRAAQGRSATADLPVSRNIEEWFALKVQTGECRHDEVSEIDPSGEDTAKAVSFHEDD